MKGEKTLQAIHTWKVMLKAVQQGVVQPSERRATAVSALLRLRRRDGVFAPIYREHAALIRRTLQDVSSEEQCQMEEALERIVRRDEELGEREVLHWDRVSTVFKCSLQPGDSRLIQNLW